MDRRIFLRNLVGAAAAAAAVPAIPFNRVWSFPKEIILPRLTFAELENRYLSPAVRQLAFDIGDIVTIKNAIGVPGYLGPFIVTAVSESDCWLKAPKHNIAAIAPSRALSPIFLHSGGPPGNPPVAQLKSAFDLPDFGIPES